MSRFERRNLAHHLQVFDKFVPMPLRQIVRERPGLGIIGRREHWFEHQGLGLRHRALPGDLDRTKLRAVDLARERVIELA